MTGLDLSDVEVSRWSTAEAFPVGPNDVDESQTVEVRWLPVTLVKLVGGRSELGITAEGEWLLHGETKDLLHSPRFGSGRAYGVALLEWAPEVVRHRCQESATRYGLDADDLWSALPWIEVVKAAFRWGAPQWVAPGLDWVELLGGEDLLLPELAAIAKSDRSPERLRCRADLLLQRAQ